MKVMKDLLTQRGLLLAIKQPIFVIILFIVHKVFGIIKILSDQLKAVVLFSKIPLRLLQTIAFFSQLFPFCSSKLLIFVKLNL